MIDKISILERARQLGSTRTLADVDAALAKRDINAYKEKHKQRYRIEIWDKKSPINGVPAEKIFSSRTDIPEGGEVYLIYIDGQLRLFQPHPPFEGGMRAMGPDEVRSIAEQHVDRMAEADAEDEIVREVLEELLS